MTVTDERRAPGRLAALTAVGTVVDLELRQRVRSTAWYVLLGVAALLLMLVTGLLLATSASFGRQAGGLAFPLLVFFVLLLGTLVTPALSGGAVNADRDAGTLATTQVTLVTAWQLVLGKFLAAWTAALAFLAIAVPFLLVAVASGGVAPDAAAVSLLVTVVELGVVAAIGVGLSAVIGRPIFSVVTTYLVVAALSVGTLLVFGLGGLAFPQRVTSTYESQSGTDSTGAPVCDPPQTSVSTIPSYWRLWGVLAVNPYAVLADAVPAHFDAHDTPADLFTYAKLGVRSAQIAQPDRTYYSDCHPERNLERDFPGGRALVDDTAPSWFVGIAVHLMLALLALGGAVRALRTPAQRLAKGSRIA